MSELAKGSRWSRWQVVRPAQKDEHGRDRSVVKCICNTETIVLNHALEHGNTRGCRSSTCRSKWEASQATKAQDE